MFRYIIWDILIALSVLLHKHFLTYLGVWEWRENEIETLEEAADWIKKFEEEKKLNLLDQVSFCSDLNEEE